MKKKETQPWFPVWQLKWLFGSTRHELDPAERSVFMDLIALSKLDDGYVRANQGIPYPTAQLAGMFVVPEKLLIQTIEKCIQHEKIKRLPDGTLYITSHEEFKLSPRWIRELKKKQKNGEEKKVDFNFEKLCWENLTPEFVALLKDTYPAVDVDFHIKKAAAWLASNPKNRKSNYPRFLNNWMSREQDRARPAKIPAQASDRQARAQEALDDFLRTKK